MKIRDCIFLRWIGLVIMFYKYKIKFRNNVHFAGLAYIYVTKGSSLEFRGKGTWINNHSVSNLFGLYQRTIFYVTNGGKVTIGEACGISGSSFCSMKEITIGDRVQIGANTKIMDNDMHSLDPIERANDVRNKIGISSVKIGDDCFVGANCIILKGTNLGDKCIVGAGSVVHGVFPDNVIIAGNPAKIIKKND